MPFKFRDDALQFRTLYMLVKDLTVSTQLSLHPMFCCTVIKFRFSRINIITGITLGKVKPWAKLALQYLTIFSLFCASNYSEFFVPI